MNQTDRDALVFLYHSTGGPGWTNSHNWLSDAPLGEWHGVTTNAGGRVVRLELYDNGLSGEIPSELVDLENLEWLDLSDNELTGEIPPELGNLASLTWLGLSENDLSGRIPSELDGLTGLVSLYLSSNKLSGEIPAELGGLASLMWLHLDSNDISGEIPPELGNLTELTYLELHENNLTGRIPPELGNLSYLETLRLGENRLSGEIPPELGELPGLLNLTLTLTGNQLSGCVPARLRNVAWENDLGALGLPQCEEEMRLFQDPWGRFSMEIPADWEEEELSTQEFFFHVEASSPGGNWQVIIIALDSGSISLPEFADELESGFLKKNPEHLVRSSFQTAQDLRAAVFEVSFEDGELVVFAYLLDEDVGIIVGYAFPAGWSDAGMDLAYRFFNTFRVK